MARKRKLRVEPPPEHQHYEWGTWAHAAHELDKMDVAREELKKRIDRLPMFDTKDRYELEYQLRRLDENIARYTEDLNERALDLPRGFKQVGHVGKHIFPRLPTLEEVHLKVERRKPYDDATYEEDFRIPVYISPVQEHEPTSYGNPGGITVEDYPYRWDGSNLLQMGFNMLGQHFWYPVKLHAHVLRAILHGSWLAVTPKSHWLPLDAPTKWD